MRSQALIALSSVLVAAALVACAGASSSDEASADELNTSPAEAKACAVRAAYLSASLADLKEESYVTLPDPALNQILNQWGDDSLESISSFFVPNVGRVFVTEQTSAPSGNTPHSILQFFSENGTQIATGSAYDHWIDFSLSYTSGDAAASAVLRCTAGGSGADASPPRDASYTPRDASTTYNDAGSWSWWPSEAGTHDGG